MDTTICGVPLVIESHHSKININAEERTDNIFLLTANRILSRLKYRDEGKIILSIIMTHKYDLTFVNIQCSVD